MYALVDCNNFYASCQRVFRPELEGKPVVVLSNNDGCIIARSNEAKALGIPMAAPEHKWKGFLKRHKVHVFSSNYALYADMSARVMSILEHFEPNIEIYSIDEAFLNVTGVARGKLHDHGAELRQTILKWTGIPTSIGFAPTKTLAKLANHITKHCPEFKGVLVLDSLETALPYMRKVKIGNVWGVGRRWAEKLQYNGIRSAADLALADPNWIRRSYSVVLQRTALELAGKSCIELENTPERKQILVSRSFRPRLTEHDKLRRFMAGYVSRAAEKLRSQNSLTKNITLFIRTKEQQDNAYANSRSINLSQYTADTATLIRAGTWAVKHMFKQGYHYYKAGVILNDLIPDKNQQYTLFAPAAYNEAARKRMKMLDAVNLRFGTETLCLGSEANNRWQMHQKHLSPAYTTRWDELLEVGL
jgi:DNA polymerase V